MHFMLTLIVIHKTYRTLGALITIEGIFEYISVIVILSISSETANDDNKPSPESMLTQFCDFI